MKKEIEDKLIEVAELCEAEGYAIAAAVTDGEATQHAITGNTLALGYLTQSITTQIEEKTDGTSIKELAVMYGLKQADSDDMMDILKGFLEAARGDSE